MHAMYTESYTVVKEQHRGSIVLTYIGLLNLTMHVIITTYSALLTCLPYFMLISCKDFIWERAGLQTDLFANCLKVHVAIEISEI